MHFLVAFALKIHLLLKFWLETQIKLTSASAAVCVDDDTGSPRKSLFAVFAFSTTESLSPSPLLVLVLECLIPSSIPPPKKKTTRFTHERKLDGGSKKCHILREERAHAGGSRGALQIGFFPFHYPFLSGVFHI